NRICPAFYQPYVPVGKLANGKLAGERAVIQQFQNELCGYALHVVQSVSLHVERSSKPTGCLQQTVSAVVLGHAVDRREIAAKLKLVAEYAWIFRDVGMEVSRTFFESTTLSMSKCVHIAEIEVPIIAVTLVLYQVNVDIQVVRSHHRDAALQASPTSIPGLDSSFLILRTQVVIVEQVIAAREAARCSFQRWRKPYRGKPGLGKLARLGSKVVPPKGNRVVAIQG